jgi:CheY-like chemotaxis protein
MISSVHSPVHRPGAKEETVLVVEDDLAVRNVFRKVLELSGYHILEAVNGEDALAVCAQYAGAVDVLITDVIMPRMGGQELARRMAARYPDMKVLFVSGYSDLEIERHGTLGATCAFLPKPFTGDVLAARVRELIEESPRYIR